MKTACIIISIISLLLIFAGCVSRSEEIREVSRDVIELGQITVTAEEKDFRELVEPEEPRGYYEFYEEHEGYRYYVISGTVENTGSAAVPSSAFTVTAETDGSRRDGKLLFLNRLNSEFTEAIEAGDTLPCFLMVLVKDDEVPERLSVFYNSDYSQEDGKSFDCQVDITL